MNRLNLLFAIDVSGIPPGHTIISCVCFDMDNYSKFIKDFKKEFKKYYHKKGRHLDESELSEILKFLDKYEIRSYSTICTENNWRYAYSNVSKRRGFKREKLCGIFYYNLLQINSIPQHPYVVQVCKEDYMKIDKVRSACQAIAKMRHMEYDITTGSDKYNNHIKIADYVASATRKIKQDELKLYKYFNLIKPDLPKEYVTKVFEKK